MILRYYWPMILILALQELAHHSVQITLSFSLAITHPYHRTVYSDLTNDTSSTLPHSTDLEIQKKLQYDIQRTLCRLRRLTQSPGKEVQPIKGLPCLSRSVTPISHYLTKAANARLLQKGIPGGGVSGVDGKYFKARSCFLSFPKSEHGGALYQW